MPVALLIICHFADIFTSTARKADIILSFDQSSDVQTGAALSRLNDFAVERKVILLPQDPLPDLPPHPLDEKGRKDGRGVLLRKSLSSEEIESRFKGRYAQVFVGWYRDGTSSSSSMGSIDLEAGLHHDRKSYPKRPPDLYIIYCPLLPHHSQPTYDPVVSIYHSYFTLSNGVL